MIHRLAATYTIIKMKLKWEPHDFGTKPDQRSSKILIESENASSSTAGVNTNSLLNGKMT